MVVNDVKLAQKPVQRGEHQFKSHFVDKSSQCMKLYDNNSKPSQNFVTDIQENVPFRPFDIHLENRDLQPGERSFSPTRRASSIDHR